MDCGLKVYLVIRNHPRSTEVSDFPSAPASFVPIPTEYLMASLAPLIDNLMTLVPAAEMQRDGMPAVFIQIENPSACNRPYHHILASYEVIHHH